MNSFGGNGVGTKTATAGTKIRCLVPPNPLGFTRVTKLVYTAQGTAHTVKVMRHIGKTTASAAAAAGQAVINLASDPGVTGNLIAANDLLAIRETDGVTRLYVVQSVSTLAITLTTNLTAGAAIGARVWNFGVEADTDPKTGDAHYSLAGTASATTTYTDTEGGLFASFEKDAPILVTSDNATAAGTVQQLGWAYTAA